MRLLAAGLPRCRAAAGAWAGSCTVYKKTGVFGNPLLYHYNLPFTVGFSKMGVSLYTVHNQVFGFVESEEPRAKGKEA